MAPSTHTGCFHLVILAKPLDQRVSPVVQGGGATRSFAVEEALMGGPPPSPAPIFFGSSCDFGLLSRDLGKAHETYSPPSDLDSGSLTQVSAVPTVLAIKNGDVVDKFVGIKDEDQLEAFLKKLIG